MGNKPRIWFPKNQPTYYFHKNWVLISIRAFLFFVSGNVHLNPFFACVPTKGLRTQKMWVEAGEDNITVEKRLPNRHIRSFSFRSRCMSGRRLTEAIAKGTIAHGVDGRALSNLFSGTAL